MVIKNLLFAYKTLIVGTTTFGGIYGGYNGFKNNKIMSNKNNLFNLIEISGLAMIGTSFGLLYGILFPISIPLSIYYKEFNRDFSFKIDHASDQLKIQNEESQNEESRNEKSRKNKIRFPITR